MATPHRYTYLSRVQIDHPNGNNDAWWVTHVSYGKESVYNDESPSPYLFSNEWIAGCIGTFLRLPVPPFAVMQLSRKQQLLFTSLQFTPDQQPPPDTKPERCWQADPNICTGIIVFDILIGNDDRRAANIAVNDPANPTEFFVHDHDQAIAGGMFEDGRNRLKTKSEEFLAKWHCLVEVIDTDKYFNDWIGRVQSIPSWFIDAICREAVTTGFSSVDAKEAAAFLKRRSQKIDELIRKHRDLFKNIKKWTTLT